MKKEHSIFLLLCQRREAEEKGGGGIQEAPKLPPAGPKLHKGHQQPSLSLLPVLPLARKSSEGPSRDSDSSAGWTTCPKVPRGRAFGITLKNQHSFGTILQKSQSQN